MCLLKGLAALGSGWQGGGIPHMLWLCMMQVVVLWGILQYTVQGLQLAWDVSFLGMLESSYHAYAALFLRSESSSSCSLLIASSGGLLLALSVAYAHATGAHEPTCIEDYEGFLAIRFNRAVAFGTAAFIYILRLFYGVAAGTAARRVVFLGLLILLLSPGMSSFVGRDFFYGPWGMFGAENDDTKLTTSGYALMALLLPLVAWMSTTSHPEILGLGWDQKGPSHILAAVRILLAYWLLVAPDWGDLVPVLSWYAPEQWPGDAMKPVLLLSVLCLGAGIRAPIAAAVIAASFCAGCARRTADPDCPTQHAAMALAILAFTPCDDSFSVKAAVERWAPNSSWSVLVGPGCAGSLWAKSLIRLQTSLLYLFAGLFKARQSWLNLHGTLYDDIRLLDFSPLRSVWYFLLPTEGARRAFTLALAAGAMVMELTLPFAIWSRSLHLYALALAAAMHLGMSALAGQLGGFSQVCWITLLGSISDKRVEDWLQEPRNFAFLVLGGIALFACIGDAFEIHGEPFGGVNPGAPGP
mmetsp:Transcript_15472/g.29192  ORF Transcript_15472/g.29192 Transcript_15472/m.29192 type:complete len:526 (+) Transcript_15472:334-1911(+)